MANKSIRFDPSLFVSAAKGVWEDFAKDERIGPFLQRKKLDHIVIRIMGEKGNTFRVEHIGSPTSSHVDEVASAFAGSDFAPHRAYELSSDDPHMQQYPASAMLRVSPIVLVCYGLPQKLGQILLIEAMASAKLMTKKRARELRLRFQPKPNAEDWEFD